MAIEALMASHKAADISKMMLTYLGLSSGKQEVQDLSETCHKGLLMVQSTIPKNISVKTEIKLPGPTVNANTSQLLQMIVNLITNAWESITDRQGNILVSVKTVSAADIPILNRFPIGWQPNDECYASIEIADTGIGIPQDNIKKIFDPFFTTKFTGRGLGLSVVLGILRTHGGGITVENRINGGCVLQIYLPSVSKTVHVVADKITRNSELQEGGVVLLIDDQTEVRNMAKVMLSRQGYAVLEASNGTAALEIFQQNQDKIRLVITDLTMPGLNGWETLAALRKISHDIPVILSSGYDESYVMAESEQDQLPNAFLGKPYHFKDLCETIRRVLAVGK